MSITDAKRLIAGSSIEGLRLLGMGVSRPCSQARYNHAAQAALSDDQADLSPAERRIIASYIEEENPEPEHGRRSRPIALRLTPDERERLGAAARSSGMSIAELVRSFIPPASPAVVLGPMGLETGPGWDALMAEGTRYLDLAKAQELAEAAAGRERDRELDAEA